ncbi:MAG: hypothetical protein ACFUZC_14975 [Chthoniobacteraceae bacterium]
MDTPLTEPTKSWSHLTAQARRALPPGDLDVRHLVRSALEAQRRLPRARERSLLEELAAVGQVQAVRAALAFGGVAATLVLWNGLDAIAGLGVAMDTLYSLLP